VVERGIWRIRTDKELGELYKDLDIADIKKKRYEWIRHVARMDQGRTVKMWRRIYGRWRLRDGDRKQ
jgi:hypothetical protein